MLTAGDTVQLWHLKPQEVEEETQVTFTLGGGESAADGSELDDRDRPQGNYVVKIVLIIS